MRSSYTGWGKITCTTSGVGSLDLQRNSPTLCVNVKHLQMVTERFKQRFEKSSPTSGVQGDYKIKTL
jgi:hypothetical protein